MGGVGARPDELRRLAGVLARTVDEVAWLRRRIDAAVSSQRGLHADSRSLARLEAWLDGGAVDLRRRALVLEEGERRHSPLIDVHPPGLVPGGCGTIAVPVGARRTEADGSDSPLGEPLFASAALGCAPALEGSRENALQVVRLPEGGLAILMARRPKRGRGGNGAAGGPDARPPTRKERLDKAKLPNGDDVPFAFEPDKKWDPRDRIDWDKAQKGYRDAKKDVWVKGPSRTPGQPFEWDVQLRKDSPWKKYLKDGFHLNIDLDGRISH